jgi:geranyl-CoA carboxylase alpha subunit
VAAGKKLPAQQQHIQFNGHAIEARLYAEDPYQGFAPQTGTIQYWRPLAKLENGLRIDSGISEKGIVSPFYDPMLAKLIVHGVDRDDAIRRLVKLLASTPLYGLRNNSRFLHDLIQHDAFRHAQMDTAMLDRWLDAGEPIMQAPVAPTTAWVLAAAVFAGQPCWRSESVAEFELTLHCDDGNSHKLRIRKTANAVFVTHQQQSFCVRILSTENNCLHYEIDGVHSQLIYLQHAKQLHIAMQASAFVFSESNPLALDDTVDKSTHLFSPLAGRVMQIAVTVGDEVSVGQGLICLEAMKMEIWVKARAVGRVRSINTLLDNQVEANTLLIEFEEIPTEAS